MKKTYILPLFLFASVGFSVQKSANFRFGLFHVSTKKYTSGSPAGKTGAPGELSCTDCHNGNVLAGNNENILTVLNGTTPVTQYVPGTTYTISLAMLSNPSKKGFQATVLDGSNSMAGSFTAGSNTSVNGSNRKYANHKTSSSTSTTTSWNWTWTAPSTNVGDVTFYIASNKANNNGSSSGDQIFLSQITISAPATSGLVEDSEKLSGLQVAYETENNCILLEFSSLNAGKMFVNLVDMSGRSVWRSDLGNALIGTNKQFLTLPADLKNGMYVVHLLVNNNALSRKIWVNR